SRSATRSSRVSGLGGGSIGAAAASLRFDALAGAATGSFLDDFAEAFAAMVLSCRAGSRPLARRARRVVARCRDRQGKDVKHSLFQVLVIAPLRSYERALEGPRCCSSSPSTTSS